MDWQSYFTQLVSIIDPTRTFPRGFDWSDKATIEALLTELRTVAKTDHAIEVERLQAQLEVVDEKSAAEARMLAAGVSRADIEKVRGR